MRIRGKLKQAGNAASAGLAAQGSIGWAISDPGVGCFTKVILWSADWSGSSRYSVERT